MQLRSNYTSVRMHGLFKIFLAIYNEINKPKEEQCVNDTNK